MNSILKLKFSSRYSKKIEDMHASSVAILTLLVSVTTLLPTVIQNLYLAYCCDALFNIIVCSCITIATFKIAHSLKTDLYGFVVGVNVCVACLIDSLFTFVFMDQHALSFKPRQQYWAYTGFALFNVIGFFVYKAVALTFCRNGDNDTSPLVTPTEDPDGDEANESLLGLGQ